MVDWKLLAQASNEDFDRVRVAVEVLLVEMLDKLGPGDHAGAVQHEISEYPIFVRGSPPGRRPSPSAIWYRDEASRIRTRSGS